MIWEQLDRVVMIYMLKILYMGIYSPQRINEYEISKAIIIFIFHLTSVQTHIRVMNDPLTFLLCLASIGLLTAGIFLE